jgi:ubiquinone/menaquinone biosynthesis C-methylase UbiE
MDHYIDIYQNQADKYHRMIAVEDVDGNLRPALENVTSLTGKRVLDLGTGTGRLPLLLHDQVSSILGLDLHWGMLAEQQRIRNDASGLIQGDIRGLPFQVDEFDIVTAGWAIGHFQGWFGVEWQNQVDIALQEMSRVVKPDGALIILETLTTGSTVPAPPHEGLAKYYTHLETNWGFTRQEISTDYQFADLEESVKFTEFFFGEELAEKIRANNWVRLPEWTGVWGQRRINF